MGTYITNIGLLATPRGHSARRGTQQGDVTLLRNAWVELCGCLLYTSDAADD